MNTTEKFAPLIVLIHSCFFCPAVRQLPANGLKNIQWIKVVMLQTVHLD